MKRIMRKIMSLFLLFSFILSYFSPILPVFAEGSYQVSILKSDGTSESLGTFSSYNEAKYKMQAHNSNRNAVAVIYKNGKIVNTNYGLVRFIEANVVPVYSDSNRSFHYTSVASSYGMDAAFLDYDDGTEMVKLRISGYTGWVPISYLNIIPITEMSSSNVKIEATTSLRVRRSPSLSGEQFGNVRQGQVFRFFEKKDADGYTWYRINYNGEEGWFASSTGWTTESVGTGLLTYYEPYKTGNLIHYFDTYYWGQSYTNLGPRPSYLEIGVSYYSFDGNFFYTDVLSMLDDYKKGIYDHALNKDQPFYAYYMYLPNHSKTNYEAEDFDRIIESYGYTRGKEEGVTYVDQNGNWISGLDRSGMSVLYKSGSAFIDAQNQYGVSALLSFSAALNESASGTSTIAFAKNNIFGHSAYDSCPFTCATTYSSVRESIFAHARLTGNSYNNPNDGLYFGGHYGNKGSGMNVNYATDPYWGEKMAGNYYMTDLKFGSQDYMATTTGVKMTLEDVNVYAEANTSSKVLYTLKNKYTSVSNMPMTVLDKVTVNGATFYKIQTDIGIDGNKNIVTDSYNANTSFGYVEASKLYVSNTQPEIHANNIEFEVGEEPNYLDGVTASDRENGDLTSRIKIKSSNVNKKVPGTYSLTYYVEDYSHFGKELTITVTVKGSTEPTITANDQEISQYTSFDAKKNVVATDYDGTDLSNLIEVEGNVNPNVLGEYELTYKVTNSLLKTATKTIIVRVKENAKPEIYASDKTIKINSSFDPMEGVSAKDSEDGDLTSNIIVKENQVDTSTPGVYSVTYEVQDSVNNKIEKTVQITVSDRTEVSGEYYFDSLVSKDNKLILTGFQTISGISNDLNEDIRYKVLFKNEETNTIIEQEIPRIVNKEDMPFDYGYSWFSGELDLSSLPDGNYSLSIMAYSKEYFSQSPLSNVFRASMETTYEGSFIRNNYESREAPIQIFVRSELIGEKTSSFKYNIENEYSTISYQDGKLKIKGASHIIGGDYSKNTNVERKLILEEITSYKRYSYNIGSIENGDYAIELRVPDGFDKTRAWFETNLDLSNVEKGTYAIYISTSSNVSDFGELRDIFSRNIKTTWESDGKTYSFHVVREKRYRVELVVK